MIILGPFADKLRSSRHLQRIIERVHAAGPRPVAELLIELLENAGAGPEALDGLEGWSQLDANVVRQLGADQFPPLPLVVVPQPKQGRGR